MMNHRIKAVPKDLFHDELARTRILLLKFRLLSGPATMARIL
jgi:hypothetical protein